MRVQNVEANGYLKLQKQGQLTTINTNNFFIIHNIVDRIYIIRSYLSIKNHENIERNPNPLPAFDTTIL